MSRGIWTLVLCLGVLVETAIAGRPLTIDDADPVDPGLFELEGGVGYHKDSGCKHWDFPLGLTYGLFQGVEGGIGFGGQIDKRSEWLEDNRDRTRVRENGIGDLGLGVKWQFFGETAWCPRQALVPSVKFPTADEDKGLGSGETDYDLTWVASKSLSERLGAHVNAGYSWIGEPEGERMGDVVHGGLALDFQLLAALQWVGEVYAERELTGGEEPAVLGQIGLRWGVSDTLIVDCAAGARISGEAPDFMATVGLTWSFGFADNGKNK